MMTEVRCRNSDGKATLTKKAGFPWVPFHVIKTGSHSTTFALRTSPILILIAYWMPIEQDGTHGVLITKASVVALAMER